ncbi:protein rolling stone-like [Stomoxys calcitrans]|uniref:Protein rolling stone n=1 Tax=Stomoxys calcitrans TaxID=35570 RepID=A0A1I8NWP7_STOCA|nr:protein rolling stone-like [Stomoxys calcitrans]
MKLSDKKSNIIRTEFNWKNFGFSYNNLDEFYRSQWQRKETSFWYLLYRWLWALFFLSVFFCCLVQQFTNGKFFIFFTNWGFLLCVATQLLGVLLVTRWHFDIGAVRSSFYEVSQLRKTPRLLRLYWLLYDLAMPVALVITTIYWAFLHGKMNKPNRFPVLSFSTHCLNSVFMLVDFLIIGFPVRLLHTLYAMLVPIVFFCFTLVYYLCGGTDDVGNHYVYPMLDWTQPSRCVITFIGIFILYCIYPTLLYGIYRVKRFFLHKSVESDRSVHRVGLI